MNEMKVEIEGSTVRVIFDNLCVYYSNSATKWMMQAWVEIERRFNCYQDTKELVKGWFDDPSDMEEFHSRLLELFQPKPLTVGDWNPGNKFKIEGIGEADVYILPWLTQGKEGSIQESDSICVVYNITTNTVHYLPKNTPCQPVEKK